MAFIKRLLAKYCINRAYTSELDNFLDRLDKAYPTPSASQLAVRKRYKSLIQLRDKGAQHKTNPLSWDGF